MPSLDSQTVYLEYYVQLRSPHLKKVMVEEIKNIRISSQEV